MQRRLLPLLGGVLLLAAALPNAPASADALPGGNLAPNGGFERDDDLDLMPDGWSVFGAPDTAARTSVLPAHGGLWALEVADAANLTVGGVVSDAIPVEPGASLLLTFWTHLAAYRPTVYIVEAPPTTLGVEYVGLGLPAPHVSVAVPATTGWTRVDVPLVVPYGVEELRIRVDPRGPALLRVDDVSLVEVAPSGNLLPNPGFETGYYFDMPDLWPLPCGVQNGIWLTPGLTEGGHDLYFLENIWPRCSEARSVPFVLPPGAYRLTGDRYLIGNDATMEMLVYGADGALLRHDTVVVKDVGRGKIVRETLDFCAPEGSAYGQVLLTAPKGNSPMYWDNMRLAATGAC